MKLCVNSTPRIDAINKYTSGPATRYVNPATGGSVVIDNSTNTVVHVGEPDFQYGPESGDLPNAVMKPAPTGNDGGGGGGSLDIFHPRLRDNEVE